MDKDFGLLEKREEIAIGKCEMLKEQQEDCRKADRETDKDVSYNESTRYYWF